MGGKYLLIKPTPRALIKPLKHMYTPPTTARAPIVAGIPQVCVLYIMGAIKTNEEAKNTGTLPLVTN